HTGQGRPWPQTPAAPFRNRLQEDVAGRRRRVQRAVTIDTVHLNVGGEAEGVRIFTVDTGIISSPLVQIPEAVRRADVVTASLCVVLERPLRRQLAVVVLIDHR